MAKEYHRATPESIPIQSEDHPIRGRNRPQEHYSAESGKWDGQLPHADIVADQPSGPEIETPNWPTLLDRMNWTRAMIRAHSLPPPQAAVLNEIAFRDGRGNGCSATMATLALDTGYNEKSVRRAIKGLEDKNIIISHGGAGQKKLTGLPVKNGQLTFPTPVTESGVKAEPRTESGVGRSQSPGYPGHRVRG